MRRVAGETVARRRAHECAGVREHIPGPPVVAAPQRGQCQTEELSAEALQVPASTRVEELLDSSCRDRAKREARQRLARNPKWRMRTKPLGSTWRKKRRRNSVAIRVILPCLPPWA